MAVTSLSMSPTADFLVTCHVDSVGLYTWYNKTLLSLVSLTPLPDDFQPQEVDLPDTQFTATDQPETGAALHVHHWSINSVLHVYVPGR